MIDAPLRRIHDVGVIPVIRAKSSQTAVDVAAALIDGGLTVAEITMTVPDALGALELVAQRFGTAAVIGAGTITTVDMAEQAIDAGATFLVTPCVLADVIAAARERNVAIICGALTPTEIVMAQRAGADAIKVFPASAVGGPAYLRSLRGPFPTLDLIPTGGVSLDLVETYIKAGAFAIGAGSELVHADFIARKDFAAIGALGRQFVKAVHAARRG